MRCTTVFFMVNKFKDTFFLPGMANNTGCMYKVADSRITRKDTGTVRNFRSFSKHIPVYILQGEGKDWFCRNNLELDWNSIRIKSILHVLTSNLTIMPRQDILLLPPILPKHPFFPFQF